MTKSKSTSSKPPVLMGESNINLDDGAARGAVANMSTRGQQSFARALQADAMQTASAGPSVATASRISATPSMLGRQPVAFGPGVGESVSLRSSGSLALAGPSSVPVSAPSTGPTVSTLVRAVAPVVVDEMERRDAQRNPGSGSGGRSGESVHVHHHNHYHRRRPHVAPVVAAAPVVVEDTVWVAPAPVADPGRSYGYSW